MSALRTGNHIGSPVQILVINASHCRRDCVWRNVILRPFGSAQDKLRRRISPFVAYGSDRSRFSADAQNDILLDL